MQFLNFNRISGVILSISALIIIILLLLKTGIENYNSSLLFLFFTLIVIIILILLLFILLYPKSRAKTGKISEKLENTEEKATDSLSLQSKKNELTDTLLAEIKNIHDLKPVSEIVLKYLIKIFSGVSGAFYVKHKRNTIFEITACYACHSFDTSNKTVDADSITGQTAVNKMPFYISRLDEGYITAVSGLGSASATCLLILPFVINNETIGIAEIASFEQISDDYMAIWKKINTKTGEKLKSLIDNE